jgi:hypothetical protein
LGENVYRGTTDIKQLGTGRGHWEEGVVIKEWREPADFASLTVHLINICVKNQPTMQQLFIQFINYVWYLLHVSAYGEKMREEESERKLRVMS